MKCLTFGLVVLLMSTVADPAVKAANMMVLDQPPARGNASGLRGVESRSLTTDFSTLTKPAETIATAKAVRSLCEAQPP